MARQKSLSRRTKKNFSRIRRMERRDLVHAAGCVFSDCSTRWMVNYPNWVGEDFYSYHPKTKFPRSLRKYFKSVRDDVK